MRGLRTAGLLLLGVAASGQGQDYDPLSGLSLKTEWETLSFPAGRFEQLTMAVANGALAIAAQRLHLPSLTLRDVRLRCASAELNHRQLRCAQGRFDARVNDLPIRGALDLHYRFDKGGGELKFDASEFANGSMTVAGRYQTGNQQPAASGLSVKVELRNVAASALTNAVPLPVTLHQGRLTGQLTLRDDNTTPAQLALQLAARGLGFANAAGTLAAEQLGGTLQLTGWLDGRLQLGLQLPVGQLYAEPIFLALTRQQPLSAELRGQFNSDYTVLTSDRLTLRHGALLAAQGEATLGASGIRRAALTLSAALAPAFPVYGQPWLGNTALAERALVANGQLDGQLRVVNNAPQRLTLAFTDASLQTPPGTDRPLALRGLDGNLAWSQGAQPQPSDLSLRGARFGVLTVGPTRLALSSYDGGLRLREQTRIPLLDGALWVTDWHVALPLTPQESSSWRFNGRLEPLSLAAVSQALGLPPLAGTLSGIIPRVAYRDRRLTAGGALQLNVFGGLVTAAQLELYDPLGAAPRLNAEIGIEDIDLAALTGVVDIGRIEGRLNGLIHDLELIDWRPTRFDARFFTPPESPGRRRISQRAIETISALGGDDMGSVLSRGVLSLFDEFRYRRLGLSCRLANGVCQLDGVAPAANGGFYLVEGSGLPRIDVIGYNHRIDWDELLARLQAAASSDAPRIE